MKVYAAACYGAQQARCPYCHLVLGTVHEPDCPYPVEQARLAQNSTVVYGAELQNAWPCGEPTKPDTIDGEPPFDYFDWIATALALLGIAGLIWWSNYGG